MDVELYLRVVFCILSFILGLCFGSFANVVIYRLPNGENIVTGGSHCTTCDYSLKWYDNVPVISYILLGGKCRKCKQKISPRYIVVELANGLIWLAFALLQPKFGYAYSITAMFASTALICVAFIDLKHLFIPDSLNVFIAVIGVIGCFLDSRISLKSRLLGLAFGAVFYGGFYLVYKLVFKREGIGLGDVKLMTACGLCFGLKNVFFGTLTASVAGAIILGLISLIAKKERLNEYPFAPFLAAGTLIAAFCGEFLVNAYLSLF